MAGIPGLPLAAALPAARALLLEPVAKKAAFLSVVASATGLAGSVEAAAVRAEALAADGRHRGRWPGVTVRAVAGLAELIELAFPLLEPGGTLVAWKRGDLDTRARRRGTGDRHARWRIARGPSGRRRRTRSPSPGRGHLARPGPARVSA